MAAIKSHALSESLTGKICLLTLTANNTLIVETGKPGKTKTTEKQFADKAEAAKQFTKKEWELLKKGFVFTNKTATAGQPLLHYFVGGGYTGALAFQPTPDGVFIYKNGWYNSATDQQDFLVLLSESGELKQTIELPTILAWDIQYQQPDNSLLLDLDHHIYRYDIETNVFTLLAKMHRTAASFITVSASKTAYASGDTFYIVDNLNEIVLQQHYTTQIVRGNIPFCAAISSDGAVLAFHNTPGKIQLISTTNGQLLHTISGDFDIIQKLHFTDHDKLLVVMEYYMRSGLRYFDINTCDEQFYTALAIPGYTKDINEFCFNHNNTILVQIQRTTAYIFDFNAKKVIQKIELEHAVKTVAAKFVGGQLGIRTDYGCFSLYAVPALTSI